MWIHQFQNALHSRAFRSAWLTRGFLAALQSLFSLGVCGCLGEHPHPHSPSAEFTVDYYDFADASVPPEALPQWPKLRLTGVLSPPPPGLQLLPEALSSDLVQDLTTPPLRVARLRSAVSLVELDSAEYGVSWLVPKTPLVAGQRYALVLPRNAETAALLYDDAPLAVELKVSAEPDAAVQLLASVPADGESAVDPLTKHMWLAFSGMLSGCRDIRLMVAPASATSSAPETPKPLDTEGRPLACDRLHHGAHTCCELVWTSDLEPLSMLRIDARGLRDARGAPVIGADVSFAVAASSTSGHDDSPGLAVTLPCNEGESMIAPGLCLRASDHSAQVRISTATAVRTRVDVNGSDRHAILPVGISTLDLGALQPAHRQVVTLSVTTASGASTEHSFEFDTLPPLPLLHITEVLADPSGTDREQEYVELHNHGDVAVVAAGMRLGPNAKTGNLLSPLTLQANGRALVVPPGYDPKAPGEPAIPPGTQRLYTTEPLTGNGLNNEGERIGLWDAAGNLLSVVPAQMAGAGQCLQRRPGSCFRDSNSTDFEVAACSPGR